MSDARTPDPTNEPAPRRQTARSAAAIAAVAIVAGAVGWTAGASGSDEPGSAGPTVSDVAAAPTTQADGTEAPTTADSGTDPAAVAQCTALLDELITREEAGLVPDEPDDELSEEELEQLEVPASDFDGSVGDSTEPVDQPPFGQDLDVAALSVDDLERSTEQCFEAGVLVDDEEGDEAEDGTEGAEAGEDEAGEDEASDDAEDQSIGENGEERPDDAGDDD